jgi:hypothetical protein
MVLFKQHPQDVSMTFPESPCHSWLSTRGVRMKTQAEVYISRSCDVSTLSYRELSGDYGNA